MSAEEILLDQLLAEEGILVESAADVIVHDPTVAGALRSGPLSHAQQRLYFLDRMMQEKSAYHVAYCVHFSAALQVDRLRRAFVRVTERHPCLRTRFTLKHQCEIDSEAAALLQEVLPDVELDWQEAELMIADVRALRELLSDPLAGPSIHDLKQLQAFSAKPFDLDAAPLSRQCLYRLKDGSYLLQWVLHHIVSDAWSRDILVEDLAQAYVHDAALPLAEKGFVDYIDFSRWQRSEAQAVELDRGLEFWRQTLSPLPDSLELPSDRPRPDKPSGKGAIFPVTLDAAAVGRVHELAKSLQVTPFIVLLCVYQTFLHRMSGQRRFLTAVPAANRGRQEVQRLVGLFLNTLALDADFSQCSSFAELARGMQKKLGRAQDHQSVPFERVVEELLTHRDVSRPPLVQTLFSLQPAGKTQLSLGELQIEQFVLPTRTSKMDLSLYLVERESADGQTISGGFEYAADLFERSTVEMMAETFQRILSACLESPFMPLEELELLSTTDVVQRSAWMGEKLDYPTQSVLELFRRSLSAAPHAIAVVDQTQQLSYLQLEERSDSIAAAILDQLRQQGLEPTRDMLIGVLLPRDSDLIATLLGVFKLGCAYLPLDPDYPAQRLEYTWQDSRAALLVTSNGVSVEGAVNANSVLHLDRIKTQVSWSPPELAQPADRLAYVTYTSGSTGTPKGVMIEQRNVVALIEWARTVLSPEQCRGVLFSTSVCFDLSVFEMFMPLSVGGAVLVADSPLALPTLVARLDQSDELPDVTLVNTVPSAIRVLCRQGLIPRSAQTITLCGELLPQAVVDELYALPQVVDVYDLYGPSEDTVYSTSVRRTAGGRQSIGRPIANTQAYVLNANMKQQPAGAVGELYLAGAGVARGYLHRDELTAEKFVSNPFPGPAHHGKVLYRTGDLVRQLSDGSLVYLRRLDDQVKLRGYRVELGEVNHALWTLGGVEEAVAVVRHDANDVPILVAYVVPMAELQPPPPGWLDGLRQNMADQLPAYMVPTVWIPLPGLPQTPNGKIDRNALPEPVDVDVNSQGAPLTTALQQELAEVWRELLGLAPERVLYADDDFFQLGGHSLLLLQLSHCVETRWHVPMALENVVNDTTLGGLAEAIELAQLSGSISSGSDRRDEQTEVSEVAEQAMERFEL